MKNLKIRLAILLLSSLCLLPSAYAQFTPSGDAYTNSANPATKYGANALLDVDGATQQTYIQFDLSSIPTGASISQATLKLYVNAVTTAGSFEVYTVGAPWTESTIDYTNEPALGSVINSGVALVAADKNQYILIPITSTVQGWVNGSVANNGIALVAIGALNTSFDSKESTSTSHPAELDIVFAGAGTVTSVATGTGLTGGPITGSGTISLTTSCSSNQILRWNGSAWMCATADSGTVTSVASGAGLTGGPITGTGTLSIANGGVTNAMLAGSYAQLNVANTFTATQTITGNLSLPNTNSGGTQGVIAFGSVPFVHDYGPASSFNSFFGFSAGNFTNTGRFLVGVGDYALDSNSSGQKNTALGYSAGTANTTGSNNTFIGYSSNAGSAALSNATAIGANSVVSQSNAFVLGGTGANAVSVGIGTATPAYTLDVQGTGRFTGAVTFAGGEAVTLTSVGANALSGTNSATSGTSNGVFGSTSSPAGTGTVGLNTSSGGYGVYGQADGTASGATGVYGNATGASTTAPTYGVYGVTASIFAGSAGVYGTNAASGQQTYGVRGVKSNAVFHGVGVAGTGTTVSATGTTQSGLGASGVWGDGVDALAGVLGTSDTGVAIFAENSTGTETDQPALLAVNESTSSGALGLEAGGSSTFCTIDVNANLNCAGTITPSVQTTAGQQVKLYSVASPENWFEDFGSAQLSGGAAKVSLDPAFASTVNTGEAYHVFLTPNGDSKGLYVATKSASGFEVREQGGGISNISFDYRIVAKRRGYENTRMEDVTVQTNKMKQRQAEMRATGDAQMSVAPPRPEAQELRVPQQAQAAHVLSSKTPTAPPQ